MNRDPSQGMSTSETAVWLARLVTPAVIDRLARIVAELSDGYRLREFLRLRAREVAEVLDSGGLIDPRKRAASSRQREQRFNTKNDSEAFSRRVN